MIRIFHEKDKAKLFALFESRKNLVSHDIVDSVRQIVSRVQKEGDRALLRFTERFDKVRLTARQLRVGRKTLQAAAKKAGRDMPKKVLSIGTPLDQQDTMS